MNEPTYTPKDQARMANATLSLCRALEMFRGEATQAGYTRLGSVANDAKLALLAEALALPSIKLVAHAEETKP